MFRRLQSSSASTGKTRSKNPCSVAIQLLKTICGTMEGMAYAQGIRIGRVLGIPIYIDFSWVLGFGLFTYLISNNFSAENPNWTPQETWTVGGATCLIFFASVVFHELAHSVVALAYKLKVLSITLFLFGGLARINRDPSTALQEFNIAVAGPLASGFLSIAFYLVAIVFHDNPKIVTSATWLSVTNLSLAVFNLLPGLPLDGGRIFRALVWGVTKDFNRATRASGTAGKLIAYTMILGGLGYSVAGHWDFLFLALMGWYLLTAAQASVAQGTIRESLVGLCAADVMTAEVPTIPANMNLEEYGSEVLRTGRRVHMVTMDDRLVGLMNVSALNQVPRDEWNMNSIQAVMVPRENIIWAAPEEPLQRLLERLIASDVNQMPVVSHGDEGAANIVGMVTREAILRVIQTRSELGSTLTAR